MVKLVVDIGGTYVRMAISQNGKDFLRDPQKLKNDLFLFLEDALNYYSLQEQLNPLSVSNIYIAKSGRNNWELSEESIQKFFLNATVVHVNDFAANAYGLLTATSEDLMYLGGSKTSADHALQMAVIGSGTGLGLAYISPHQTIHATHGGHMLPALRTNEQIELFHELQSFKTDGTIPIYEDALSGKGILNIYKTLSALHHLDCEYIDTHHLIQNGRNDPLVKQTLKFYHEILGLFAHQVLAFGGSYGALFLTGGITDRLIGNNLFDKDTFLNSLYQNNVPVVLEDVKSTPIFWVKDEFLSLRGLLQESERRELSASQE